MKYATHLTDEDNNVVQPVFFGRSDSTTDWSHKRMTILHTMYFILYLDTLMLVCLWLDCIIHI